MRAALPLLGMLEGLDIDLERLHVKVSAVKQAWKPSYPVQLGDVDAGATAHGAGAAAKDPSAGGSALRRKGTLSRDLKAVVFASSITGAGAQGRWPVPWHNMPWNEVAVQVLHFLLLLVGVLVTLEHMRQWAYEAYRWWLGEPVEGSTEEPAVQQPAAEPIIQMMHPDRMYWTTRGGRIHLTRNCPSLRNSQPEAILCREVCQTCGEWRVWSDDPPAPSQAAGPKQSARRGGHRHQREPPRDDSGLQFTLQPEDIVPTPPAREEPPEEEPEPSLDSEIDESWPGSRISGGQEHQ